jgi:hypothetical protein
MPWVTLTVSGFLDRISDQEMEVMEAAGEGNPNPERIDGILRQVTAQVRGKVAACDKNVSRMGPAGTIPEECEFAAYTIARHALIASQPTREGMSDMRTREIQDAYDYLDAVAACDVAIPDDSGNYPGQPASPTFALYGGNPKECF